MRPSISRPPQAGRRVAVALFERAQPAREAIQSIAERGVGLFSPGAESSGLLGGLNTAADAPDVLVGFGVPDGEARYYAHEVEAGRTLAVVEASTDYASVRERLLSHGGYDVQSRGAELARADGDDAGVSSGSVPQPIDVTDRWVDVRSRYEMLWQQHYGTTDATWAQMEPVYRYAWDMANEPRWRGRPWPAVAAEVRAAWGSASRELPWDAVAGPIRDVWQDVVDEATTGAEGGQDRRIPRQGSDQRGPAREITPPRS